MREANLEGGFPILNTESCCQTQKIVVMHSYFYQISSSGMPVKTQPEYIFYTKTSEGIFSPEEKLSNSQSAWIPSTISLFWLLRSFCPLKIGSLQSSEVDLSGEHKGAIQLSHGKDHLRVLTGGLVTFHIYIKCTCIFNHKMCWSAFLYLLEVFWM